MSKKIIGLKLAFKTTNYGAQLQAFATQQVLEKMGYTTEVIDLTHNDFFAVHSFGLGYLRNMIQGFKKKRILKKTRVNIEDKLYQENREERKKAMQNFLITRFLNVKPYFSYKNLTKSARQMDAVLIGSDQIWGPGACYDKMASLDFAPKGVRRISYATSLGVSEYPKYCWYMSRRMWNKMDYLSVREKTGASIIKQICGDIPVEVVVDPTYLLTKEEWETLIPVKQMISGGYVFCYFLGNDDEIRHCAKEFAQKQRLPLVSVLSNESFSEYDQQFADKLVLGASPEDFINWIRGASYVITDSFHGLAFSVINEKQFFISYRKRDDAVLNRNSRINDVLALWGLEDRLITDKNRDWNAFIVSDINYKYVKYKLATERLRSLDYLKKALPAYDN